MKGKFSKKLLSVFLCFALLMTYLPLSTMAAPASGALANCVSDPGTADKWADILGSSADGSRYAGRVWVDKSVYTDGDTVTLDRKGNANSTFVVDVDEANGEYFQIVFSALGSSMSTNTLTYATRPLDVAIVLVWVFITNLKREAGIIKKEEPQHANCVSRHPTGVGVHNQPKARGRDYKKKKNLSTRIACRGTRLVWVFITNLKREAGIIKKEEPQHANCVSRHSTGTSVHNECVEFYIRDKVAQGLKRSPARGEVK